MACMFIRRNYMEMVAMVTLKVGGKYKDGFGDIVIIERKRFCMPFKRAFIGNNKIDYKKNGRTVFGRSCTRLALIEEVIDPVLRLKVGKKYINGIGGIVEITKEVVAFI